MTNDYKNLSNQTNKHPDCDSALPNLHTYSSNEETQSLLPSMDQKLPRNGTAGAPVTSFSKAKSLKERAKKEKERHLSAVDGIPWQIYLSRALSAWGDRIWDFALGIFMNLICPENLRLAAIQGFMINTSVILFGSTIGNWIDKNKRLNAAKIFLAVQNVAVAIACGVLVVHFFILSDMVRNLICTNTRRLYSVNSFLHVV